MRHVGTRWLRRILKNCFVAVYIIFGALITCINVCMNGYVPSCTRYECHVLFLELLGRVSAYYDAGLRRSVQKTSSMHNNVAAF
jgi:hypothetical protein